jgi:hypothetical protein
MLECFFRWVLTLSYYPRIMIITAFFAFWVVLFGYGVYLLVLLHRKYYLRRSALMDECKVLMGERYTLDQIRAAFRKTFAAKLGDNTPIVYKVFMSHLTEKDS